MRGFTIRSILFSMFFGLAGAAWARLNRLGFGPRPGDLNRIREQSLEVWIAGQLDPQRDQAIEKRLEAYETLSMARPSC